MPTDLRQVTLGTVLLLVSGALFVPTGVDARVPVLLAAAALGGVAVVVAHRLVSAGDRTA